MPRLGVNQSGPYAPLTRSFSSASADTNAIAGAGVPRNRNQHSCLAKPVGRHIAVDSFVLTGTDEVGLVPDAGPIGLAYPPPVVAPSVQVRIFLVLGERFEMIERPPVLHDGLETRLVTQQALLSMFQQVVKHVVHASATTELAVSEIGRDLGAALSASYRGGGWFESTAAHHGRAF